MRSNPRLSAAHQNEHLRGALPEATATAHRVVSVSKFGVVDNHRDLETGLAKRDPEKKPLEIIAGQFVAIGKGDHIQEARDAARGLIGFYVGGMGAKTKNFYNDLFKRYGWEEEAEEIQDLFLSGKRMEAFAAVPEEYIDLSALIGDEGFVRERIQVFKEVGVTHLNVSPIGPDPLKQIEMIKAWSE